MENESSSQELKKFKFEINMIHLKHVQEYRRSFLI